jgi:hypothetical protein
MQFNSVRALDGATASAARALTREKSVLIQRPLAVERWCSLRPRSFIHEDNARTDEIPLQKWLVSFSLT